MNDKRLLSALSSVVEKASDLNWIIGRLGKKTGESTYQIEVPGKPGMVYVSLGANGTEGVTTAEDKVGLDFVGFQIVRMRKERGLLVVRDAEHLGSAGISGNSPIPNTIDDLDDVVISSPSAGQFLRWDATTLKWVNETVTDSAVQLGGLSDVQL